MCSGDRLKLQTVNVKQTATMMHSILFGKVRTAEAAAQPVAQSLVRYATPQIRSPKITYSDYYVITTYRNTIKVLGIIIYI
jgi:hypothetical protein